VTLEFIIELIKDVIIFALGFGAAELRDWRRSGARKKNMLHMVQQELSRNRTNIERLLQKAMGMSGWLDVEAYPVEAEILTDVFMTHLIEIGGLREPASAAIYDAYRAAQDILGAAAGQRVQRVHVSFRIPGELLETALEKIDTALRLLPNG